MFCFAFWLIVCVLATLGILGTMFCFARLGLGLLKQSQGWKVTKRNLDVGIVEVTPIAQGTLGVPSDPWPLCFIGFAIKPTEASLRFA